MPLVLRLSVYSDEDRVRELNARCSTERFDFLAGVGTLSSTAESHSTANADWTDCPRQRHATARGGADLPAGWLPADFPLTEIRGDNDWEDEGPIIGGRVSIRYGLTENLLNYDGHLGYAVAPGFRRQDHATEILRQSLTLRADRGIGRMLVTCDEDNVGSAAVIETNGGVLEDPCFKPGDSVPKRRYWISH